MICPFCNAIYNQVLVKTNDGVYYFCEECEAQYPGREVSGIEKVE